MTKARSFAAAARRPRNQLRTTRPVLRSKEALGHVDYAMILQIAGVLLRARSREVPTRGSDSQKCGVAASRNMRAPRCFPAIDPWHKWKNQQMDRGEAALRVGYLDLFGFSRS